MVLPTSRLRRLLHWTRLLLTSRLTHLTLFLIGWMWLIGTIVGSVRYVYIYEDRQVLTAAVTREETPEAMLREQGIEVRPEDEIQFSGFDSAMCEIRITRAFTVHLRADGVIRTFTMTSGTVRDLLEMGNITLRSHDTVSMHLSQELSEGDIVDVSRVDIVEEVEEQPIPYEVDIRYTSLLKDGRQRVLSAGTEGVLSIYTRDIYVDGKLVESNQTEERVTRQPVTEYRLEGAKVPTNANTSVPLDENGNPIDYLYKIDGVATAYNVRPGRSTASGRDLIVGHVAVDPAEFPYGTRMYIKTPSGSFIYGEAIAADTGVAMVEGHVDVDLLFETYLEATMFGRRNVEIYVLE